MHRAILNIVTNAIDACLERENGRVEVSTQYSHAERMARVAVVDNGSGIEKDDLEKIFAVFVSRKGGRGTGLGLPVSQKILEEHGGRIRVESKLGEGSRFTLEFPAISPPTAATDQPRSPGPRQHEHRCRPRRQLACLTPFSTPPKSARPRLFATSKFTTRSARQTIAPPSLPANMTIASPSPVPPSSGQVVKKRWKSRSWFAGLIPGPWSRTATTSRPSRPSTVTSTGCPPR